MDTSFDVEVYDVDLFEAELSGIVDTLHGQGRAVICYFSAGTCEPWRPDEALLDEADKGEALPDWPDELWLDTRSAGVRAIMESRLDRAVGRCWDG